VNRPTPYVSDSGLEVHLVEGGAEQRHVLLLELLEALRAALDGLSRKTRSKGRRYRRRVSLDYAVVEEFGGQWDAGVKGSAPRPYDVQLSVDLEDEQTVARCNCPAFGRWGGACKHVAATLFVVIEQLEGEVGLSPSTPRQPATWERSLQTLDGYLRSAGLDAESEGRAPDRIVWRLAPHSPTHAVLHAYLQRPKQRGGGYTKGAKLTRSALLERTDLQRDPEVAALCRVLQQVPFFYANAQGGVAGDSSQVAAALYALADSQRITWTHRPETPARVVRATLRLRLLARDDGGVALEAWLGELPFTPRYVSKLSRAQVEVDDVTVYVAKVEPRVAELAGAIQRARPVFPPEAVEQLVQRLRRLEDALPLEVDEALRTGREAADGRLRVRLTPDGDRLRIELRVAPTAHALEAPGEGSEVRQGWHGGRLRELVRDLDAERALGLEVAAGLGLADDLEGCTLARWGWALELARGLDAVAALDAGYTDDPRVLVEWPLGEAFSVSRTLSTADLRVTVDESRDWFGLQAGVEVDGEVVPLEKLLGALQRGERYVALDRGRWLALSRELQRQLRALVDVAQPVERKGELLRLELDATAAPVLEEVLGEAGQVQVGARWGEVRKRLARARRVGVTPPKALRAELRDYQREGFAWLKRLATWGVGACLADDMGLGKTLQALAVLLARKASGPALVVAPTSVGANWARELARFTPTLRAVDYRSSPRSAEFLAGLAKRDVVIVSYDLARIDRAKLAGREWGSAVFDEAQQVKNATTKTARALRTIPAAWRLALTGTPVENHLGDLWSLFALISPGLLGSWERFKRRFAQPIERDRDPERAAALARLIQPFVLRRTKDAVLTDLPPRTEIELSVELSKPERALYEETRLATVYELTKPKDPGEREQQRRFQILAALTRLRQLACHPGLIDAGWSQGSAKLEAFLELVADLREGGHRALVFSQFVRHLQLVRAELEAAGVACLELTGATPARQRQQLVDAFQAGEAELFLISLKAGGKGLNLTGADYVIHLDPWWNPAVEDQATDRAHRIGQTRPVTVYRLVTQGTIEDKILALHAEKRDLVDQVLAGGDRASKLSPDELLALLRGDADLGPPPGPPPSTSNVPSVRDAQVAPLGQGRRRGTAAGTPAAGKAGSTRKPAAGKAGSPRKPAAGKAGSPRKPAAGKSGKAGSPRKPAAGKSGKAGKAPAAARGLATRLKALRTAHGLTQTQLAQLLEASTASVSRWEQGHRPRPAVAERFARLEAKSARAIRRALRQG